ncbi:hypothetical protein, partial [Salmonella enterica]|uniref:hypothetical protein n=1 Tax=Salmonella enterica TaxID=28901 RepID=UPI0021B35095
ILLHLFSGLFFWGPDVPLLAFVLDTLLVATFRLADIDSHGVHRLFIVVGVAVSATLRGACKPGCDIVFAISGCVWLRY